jgi:hypothetical protein
MKASENITINVFRFIRKCLFKNSAVYTAHLATGTIKFIIVKEATDAFWIYRHYPDHTTLFNNSHTTWQKHTDPGIRCQRIIKEVEVTKVNDYLIFVFLVRRRQTVFQLPFTDQSEIFPSDSTAYTFDSLPKTVGRFCDKYGRSVAYRTVP